LTRLEEFLKARKIRPGQLEEASGYSRQHILRIRRGQIEPRRRCIVAIVKAVSKLTNSRVRPEELFDLSEDDRLEPPQAEPSEAERAKEQRLQAAAKKLIAALEAGRVPFSKWLAAIEAKERVSKAMAEALYERGRELTFENARNAEQVHRIAVAVAEKLPRDEAEAISILGRAHMGRGNALAQLADYPGAFAAFDDAETVLTESPHCLSELAQVWYSRARTHYNQTAYDEATRWVRRARAIFDATQDERMGALSRVLEGTILYDTGSPAEAERLLRTTLDPLERVQDDASIAFACMDIGRCNVDLGEVKAARVWLDRARSIFLKLQMRSEVVRAQWFRAWLRALHENADSGLEELYRARREFEELAMPTEAALVGLDIVEVLLLDPSDGAAARAAQVCRSIVDTFQRNGETASIRRAIADLREALQRNAADRNAVREVKQYLKRWSNDPQAVFAPSGATAADHGRSHG